MAASSGDQGLQLCVGVARVAGLGIFSRGALRNDHCVNACQEPGHGRFGLAHRRQRVSRRGKNSFSAMIATPDALKRQLRYAKYRIFGFSTSPPLSENWEREYAQGDWEFLGDLSQLAHYSTILGYCWFFQSRSILDVCCGKGTMARVLQTLPYEIYNGFDISDHAIDAAEASYGNACTRFFRADAEAFQPERRFDTIVFNECLYYFDQPQALIRRYRKFLEPNGLMIVSTFVSGQERAILRLIETEATTLDSTTVTNRQGLSWIVSVFGEPPRPNTAPGTGTPTDPTQPRWSP